MKLCCEVIKDLLPLYHDDVCSEQTKKLVEKHLETCDGCKEEAKQLEIELGVWQVDIDDTKPMKTMKKRWTKEKRRWFTLGMILGIVTLLVVGFLINDVITKKNIPVGASSLEVTNIVQLKNGNIAMKIRAIDKLPFTYSNSGKVKDGVRCYTILRSIMETKFSGHYDEPKLARKNMKGTEDEYYTYDMVSTKGCNTIFVGTEEDSILIWKKGMKLPIASEELEKWFAR